MIWVSILKRIRYGLVQWAVKNGVQKCFVNAEVANGEIWKVIFCTLCTKKRGFKGSGSVEAQTSGQCGGTIGSETADHKSPQPEISR